MTFESVKARQYRKLMNTALGLIHQLQMKGVPSRIGCFEFTTAKRQTLMIGNNRKIFKKPYYVIKFDPEQIPLSLSRGNPYGVKRYIITLSKINSLKAKVIR